MYDEIYRRRWDKDPFMYALLGGDGATVTFVKYEDNKRRKDILHTFFAKSSVHNVQWLIQENVSQAGTKIGPIYTHLQNRLRNSVTTCLSTMSARFHLT